MLLRFIKRCFSLGWVVILSIQVKAYAQPQDISSTRLLHTLQSLKTCGSVLYIAAHPDDENTRLISYLVNEKHYRTAYLSLTRGDGGQNLIGDEQGVALGQIRSHELLQARRKDGATQYFTRAYDFGYSKSPEETLRLWNEELVLEDMVRVIREFQPDVLICRFPTTGEGGHGHHTASAMLAEKAMEAAADPTRFPGQLQTLTTWKAERLLWNTFNFGNRNTTAPDQLQLEVGGYNALLGKSYGEIAAESRSCHSSQAFGTARNRGNITEFFKTLKGSKANKDLLEGIDLTWNRFDPTGEIQAAITRLQNYPDVWISNPAIRLPELLTLYNLLHKSPHIPEIWKKHALQKLQHLILGFHGWYAECTTPQAYVSPGDSLHLSFTAVQRVQNPMIALKQISLNGYTEKIDSFMPAAKLFSRKISLIVPEGAAEQPYWLQKPIQQNMFQVHSDYNPTLPEAKPRLNLQITLGIGLEEEDVFSLTLEIPVMQKVLDPSKGEVYQPLYVAPPATLNFTQPCFVFTDEQAKGKQVEVKVRAFQNQLKGKVSLDLPSGWTCVPDYREVHLALAQEEQLLSFLVIPPAGKRSNQQQKLKAKIETQGQLWHQSFLEINYPHIPRLVQFNPAEAILMEVQLQHKLQRVGYISGAGDKIPQALKECGITVEEITEATILNQQLSRYQAIITGVRAWNTEAQLKTWHADLLDYVKQGGVLLVQYNTTNGLLIPEPGPYPMKITRERTTDETAPPVFINPLDPALTYPNRLTQQDFELWVQERGLYYGESTDPQYRMPLAFADPGEKEQSGSLLIADYGKGRFIYTGLAFFRQLPAGVPGAYRLFLNLLHPPK